LVVLTEAREVGTKQFNARNDYDIHTGVAVWLRTLSENLSNQSLSTIPSDRVAQLARGNDSQPGRGPWIGRNQQREEPSTNALSAVKNLLELRATPESPALAEVPGRCV
jgi:hypothetical protein